MNWLFYALLSALCAGLVSIFGEIGACATLIPHWRERCAWRGDS